MSASITEMDSSQGKYKVTNSSITAGIVLSCCHSNIAEVRNKPVPGFGGMISKISKPIQDFAEKFKKANSQVSSKSVLKNSGGSHFVFKETSNDSRLSNEGSSKSNPPTIVEVCC